MGDFHQHGIITTLHQLNQRPLDDLERDLLKFRKQTPLALILPSLYSELSQPALTKIVDELTHVTYLDQLVIGLDRAHEAEYRHALSFFDRLPQRPQVLWNDGPRLRKIDERLQQEGLAPREPGKGRNVWYMFGYILATGKAQVVALHDCDIKTYDRRMLAHLMYPLAHPEFSYKFCKGYYARIADSSMNGRVFRLLVTPLLRALKSVCGADQYLDYLDSFRYALAGEFALQRDVIQDIRIPSDWGLEMGILSEMHRNYATGQICQVDIADTYDHKHQDLSAEDRDRGLSRMSSDIAKSLFRKMATQGHEFPRERVRTIKAAYYRIALDLIDSYNNDAIMNGLRYDRHAEGLAVETFAENIMRAGSEFLDQPMDIPFMPSWKRVLAAFPDIFDQLQEAVELDMQEFGGSPIGGIPEASSFNQRLQHRVEQHVGEVYGPAQASEISANLLQHAGLDKGQSDAVSSGQAKWDESDILVVTYGDSIQDGSTRPLKLLHRFLNRELKSIVSGVHILPFCPYSSDDGFSIIDYLRVNSDLGSWSDIEAIAEDYTVMADLVLNHCSAKSTWFKNYLAGQEPGSGYFIEANPEEDHSLVVRPRSHPLLTKVETVNGERHVWCTFSPDQVDLNLANPQVLYELTRILRFYVDHGIRYFRLDAVAYLWKEAGTPCVHLPQTHEIIKILRLILEAIDPSTVLITETNVPNRENLSYFGNNNEAHLIYNFSLPPLLIHAMLVGSSEHLNQWMMSMPPARRGRAYLNFLASHDGIGIRPTEGLLSETEREAMLETLKGFGGTISMRRMSNGEEKPYEANISLYDALKGTTASGEDKWQMARFICAHTIVLALEGIPGIYIHSLLGTENDHSRVEETGRARSINRHAWQQGDLDKKLSDPDLHHRPLLEAMKHRMKVRKAQRAFHPNATQYTLHLGDSIFGFWRESIDREQNIFALHNLRNTAQEIPLIELSLIATESWIDLLTNTALDPQSSITLPPYGCMWLTNGA